MDNSIFKDSKTKLEYNNEILKKLETGIVVTHFGDDLDNKSAVYALEKYALENGILKEGEHLTVERVPAGQIKEGMLNVDTGGHKGSRFDEDTLVIDGNPAEGIKSASAELANLGIYVPEQIVELADTIPNKVSPLESRTALSLIRSANGEQIFEIAEAGLLDKALTDEQLEKYGLVEAQKNQQAIIDNAVEKVNKYMVELENGEKVVIAPEQILAGAQIAYELGANYYGSVQAHKSGKGSTFAVTSKPGIKLPEQIKEFGQDLVEQYKEEDGTSGVFLNPNGQMLVAGGFKNPDFSVEYAPEELIEELKKKFKDYELTVGTKLEYASEELKNDPEIVIEAVKKDAYALRYDGEETSKHSAKKVSEGISPREGEIEEVLDETIAEQSRVNNQDKEKEGEAIGAN